MTPGPAHQSASAQDCLACSVAHTMSAPSAQSARSGSRSAHSAAATRSPSILSLAQDHALSFANLNTVGFFG